MMKLVAESLVKTYINNLNKFEIMMNYYFT
jgi:hypothetical protein